MYGLHKYTNTTVRSMPLFFSRAHSVVIAQIGRSKKGLRVPSPPPPKRLEFLKVALTPIKGASEVGLYLIWNFHQTWSTKVQKRSDVEN